MDLKLDVNMKILKYDVYMNVYTCFVLNETLKNIIWVRP